MYKENLIKHLKEADEYIKQNNLQKPFEIYQGILAEIPGLPDAY